MSIHDIRRLARPRISPDDLTEWPVDVVRDEHAVRVRRAKPTARRGVAPALLVAAVFTLAMALMLPLFVYPRLAVFPADPQALQLQQATGGTVLMPDADAPGGARTLKGVDVEIGTFVSQAQDPGNGDSIVWRIATSIYSGDDLVNARVENVSLDKRTGLTDNCCDDRLFTEQGDTVGTPLTHNGYVTFPFNTQKQTYRLWDIQLRRARPAIYQGQERRGGFDTYRFEAQTPLTRIGTQDLPGALFGDSAASVSATTEYSDTRTFWVEPNTGTVVDMHDVLRQQFTYQGKTVIAVDADLSSPPLAPRLLDQTRTGAQVLPWIRYRASWVLILVGLGLVVAWSRVRGRTA